MVIWKYKLNFSNNHFDHCDLMMPQGAKILWFAVQENCPTIWVIVDSNRPLVKRRFKEYFTGEELDSHLGEYVGSGFFYGKQVNHFFDLGEIDPT